MSLFKLFLLSLRYLKDIGIFYSGICCDDLSANCWETRFSHETQSILIWFSIKKKMLLQYCLTKEILLEWSWIFASRKIFPWKSASSSYSYHGLPNFQAMLKTIRCTFFFAIEKIGKLLPHILYYRLNEQWIYKK